MMSTNTPALSVAEQASVTFKNFCRTGDALYLSELPEEIQKIALFHAKKAIKTSSCNRYIAVKILNYFGQFESKSTRKDTPEKVFEKFCLKVTGAFPGDTIVGIQKIVRGLYLRYIGVLYILTRHY